MKNPEKDGIYFEYSDKYLKVQIKYLQNESLCCGGKESFTLHEITVKIMILSRYRDAFS